MSRLVFLRSINSSCDFLKLSKGVPALRSSWALSYIMPFFDAVHTETVATSQLPLFFHERGSNQTDLHWFSDIVSSLPSFYMGKGFLGSALIIASLKIGRRRVGKECRL